MVDEFAKHEIGIGWGISVEEFLRHPNAPPNFSLDLVSDTLCDEVIAECQRELVRRSIFLHRLAVDRDEIDRKTLRRYNDCMLTQLYGREPPRRDALGPTHTGSPRDRTEEDPKPIVRLSNERTLRFGEKIGPSKVSIAVCGVRERSQEPQICQQQVQTGARGHVVKHVDVFMCLNRNRVLGRDTRWRLKVGFDRRTNKETVR